MNDTRVFEIEGMSCQNCVRHVTRALNSVEGLSVRGVNIGSASVEFDPAEVSEEQILAALRDAGYPASATAANG